MFILQTTPTYELKKYFDKSVLGTDSVTMFLAKLTKSHLIHHGDELFLHVVLSISRKRELTTTSHQSEWPSLIRPQITTAGGVLEKSEPSCTVGGNVNWYSHCGEQFGDTLEIYT